MTNYFNSNVNHLNILLKHKFRYNRSVLGPEIILTISQLELMLPVQRSHLEQQSGKTYALLPDFYATKTENVGT